MQKKELLWSNSGELPIVFGERQYIGGLSVLRFESVFVD
jgi:hypothetical protein